MRQGTTLLLSQPLGCWGVGLGPTNTGTCFTGYQSPTGCQELLPWVLTDFPQDDLEEDAPGASLWPTTVTLLTLFLLSLFYSTALTATSIRGPPSSTGGPQY